MIIDIRHSNFFPPFDEGAAAKAKSALLFRQCCIKEFFGFVDDEMLQTAKEMARIWHNGLNKYKQYVKCSILMICK